MKAVVASVIGPYADVLSLCSVPKPELVAGTVLVRVLSAGLAFPDVLVVEGKHMMRRDPPFTPGQEICGLVVAVGEGVASVAVGQQVFGPCLSGGLAEFALVDACECFHAPRAMDPHTAAGFELNYGTSWHGLVDLAGLRAGETLLVLGASGGIGLSAIAIGVARGARVVAAASTDARLEACRQAGAHVALSYAGGAPGKALKAALAAAGLYGEVDVVLDPVGGVLSEVALRALGWGGRFLVVGFASGGATPKAAIPRLPLNLALLNERRVLGVFWGAWKARERDANRANIEQMLRLVEQGELQVPAGRVYRLGEWRTAFDDLMEHRAVGKVCIDLGTPEARL